jgi:hypothetical protein
VDNAGEKRAAWAKTTSSAGVAEPMAVIAEWQSGGAGDHGVGRGKCHNGVSGVRWPVRTMVSLTDTVTSVCCKECTNTRMVVGIPYMLGADVTVGTSLFYSCLLDSLTEVR